MASRRARDGGEGGARISVDRIDVFDPRALPNGRYVGVHQCVEGGVKFRPRLPCTKIRGGILARLRRAPQDSTHVHRLGGKSISNLLRGVWGKSRRCARWLVCCAEGSTSIHVSSPKNKERIFLHQLKSFLNFSPLYLFTYIFVALKPICTKET